MFLEELRMAKLFSLGKSGYEPMGASRGREYLRNHEGQERNQEPSMWNGE